MPEFLIVVSLISGGIILSNRVPSAETMTEGTTCMCILVNLPAHSDRRLCCRLALELISVEYLNDCEDIAPVDSKQFALAHSR